MTSVVVVESPAKAKTINKYLGKDYVVIPSIGHVRDLPPKDGSVNPDEDFAMKWQTSESGAKQISKIVKALKDADELILATDPDREGEAISWHVRAALMEKKALTGKKVQRVTFHEITKHAILEAMQHPRELDQPLIDAYLARRALDYLVGFTLSPVLWRKLPGSRSAGRVQSVALRLICEREAEIEVFKPREYWSVTAQCTCPEGQLFQARLTHLAGTKLEQFSLGDETAAHKAQAAVQQAAFKVEAIEKRRTKRHPAPPFTTSTMQQEASRKLGLSAQNTMRTAQQLYEGVDLGGETTGLITYMRTDGVTMAKEAVEAIRQHIGEAFGAAYRPEKPRLYNTKTKNAQEAHEAIRPTDISRTPDMVAGYLNADQAKLYRLIWQRTVAAQMQSAEIDQTAVVLADPTQGVGTPRLRATGSVIAFDGFLKLYREGQDSQDERESGLLPELAEGDSITLGEVVPEQHFTQPPPRYTEASLVKTMEDIGIGRPSTYASILGVLRDRNYVTLENRRFMPEDRGRIVTTFLVKFFERYVDTGFTAALEEQLDEISGGRADWHQVMGGFWQDFSGAVGQTSDLKISDVIDVLDADLGDHFFPAVAEGQDPRTCSVCHTGRMGLKLGRHGAFLGCSNYPECRNTRPLALPESADAVPMESEHLLGHDPETGEVISVRRGPYGFYLQRGEANPEDKKSKPKRAAIPAGISPANLDLKMALGLLSLPRPIGVHPETGQAITAGLGRFGPFVRMGSIYGSLSKEDDVLTVGLERALEVLAKKLASIRNLGLHPVDGEPVMVRKGRFGPYVQHDQTIANLPKETAMDDVTMEEALQLLAEKGKPLKGRKTTRKAATKKTTTSSKASSAAKPAKKTKATTASKKATAKKATAKTATRTTTKARTTKTTAKAATATTTAKGKTTSAPQSDTKADDVPF
ncbi:type I DNA topoisomerase [Formicincola oecophyllae]|uniref:DNA topoisomerase 1 n=1 Tax=Formicincola oecophyllae TaxID=2558361 RepID=A0A4Y6UC68_9PROT|nr:type I DNA topoisomerase [Formicincola oecophyllae]QDH13715.1 type I DNA topoisomerase [Formicincola oecophyllae]